MYERFFEKLYNDAVEEYTVQEEIWARIIKAVARDFSWCLEKEDIYSLAWQAMTGCITLTEANLKARLRQLTMSEIRDRCLLIKEARLFEKTYTDYTFSTIDIKEQFSMTKFNRMILAYIEGKNDKEICQELEISKMTLWRAKQELKLFLENLENSQKS